MHTDICIFAAVVGDEDFLLDAVVILAGTVGVVGYGMQFLDTGRVIVAEVFPQVDGNITGGEGVGLCVIVGEVCQGSAGDSSDCQNDNQAQWGSLLPALQMLPMLHHHYQSRLPGLPVQ